MVMKSLVWGFTVRGRKLTPVERLVLCVMADLSKDHPLTGEILPFEAKRKSEIAYRLEITDHEVADAIEGLRRKELIRETINGDFELLTT